MTMAVPNATEAKYLSSTIMPVPHRAPRFVVHIYHNYCLYTFTLTCLARCLVTYAVVSTKPRANNIKIWFSHGERHSFRGSIKSRKMCWWIPRARRASASRDEPSSEGWVHPRPSEVGYGNEGRWRRGWRWFLAAALDATDRSRPVSAEGDRKDRLLTLRRSSQMDNVLG